MSVFSNIIFKLDIKITYIFVEPQNQVDQFNLKNCFKNLFFYINKKDVIRFLKLLIVLEFFLVINLLKILYLPLILLIFFSKYRFAQLNYTQVGAISEHINLMFKKNFIDGYKTIFLIPSNSKFSFLSEILKNQIILNNTFLNIFLLPLKHTKLISCTMNEADYLFDENLNLRSKTIKSDIINNYSEKNLNCNFFELNKNFLIYMNNYFQKYFRNIDFNKAFILHQRDNYYNLTSNLRGSEASTYKLMIEHILSLGFYLIRFVNKQTEKFDFNSEKYIEINTDLKDEFNQNFNIKLQFYLIYVSKGLICTSSGPASIGSLFSKPVYDTNNYGPNVNSTTKEGTYILKKILHEGKILSIKDLKKLAFYEGLYSSDINLNKLGIEVVNNTEIEILDGFKDFLNNIQNDFFLTKEQLKFREELPNIDLKYYKSNISQSFLTNNKNFLD